MYVEALGREHSGVDEGRPPLTLLYAGPDAAALALRARATAPHAHALATEDPVRALVLCEEGRVHAVVSLLEDRAARRLFSALSVRYPDVVRIQLIRPGCPFVDAASAFGLATLTIGPRGLAEVPRLAAGAREH